MNEDISKIVIKEPYGFIYITTNMINGKRYLGQKNFDKKRSWEKYLGSGSILKSAVKKYGKDSFVRNIIDIAYSQDELNQKEYDYSIFFNVVESDDWYNLMYGGRVVSGITRSNETREKLRKSLKGKFSGEKNPNYGKHHSEETKKKIAEKQKGRHPSEETRQKLKSRTGERSSKHRPVYCSELNKIFWGPTEAEQKGIAKQRLISSVLIGDQKTSGKHPETGELLHWFYVLDRKCKDGKIIQGAISLGYITQQDYDDYLNSIKNERN